MATTNPHYEYVLRDLEAEAARIQDALRAIRRVMGLVRSQPTVNGNHEGTKEEVNPEKSSGSESKGDGSRSFEERATATEGVSETGGGKNCPGTKLSSPVSGKGARRSHTAPSPPEAGTDVNVATVLQAVGKTFGFGEDQLIGRDSSRDLRLARSAAMCVLHDLGMSQGAIGEAFDGRAPAGICAMLKIFRQRLERDAHLRTEVAKLQQTITEG